MSLGQSYHNTATDSSQLHHQVLEDKRSSLAPWASAPCYQENGWKEAGKEKERQQLPGELGKMPVRSQNMYLKAFPEQLKDCKCPGAGSMNAGKG